MEIVFMSRCTAGLSMLIDILDTNQPLVVSTLTWINANKGTWMYLDATEVRVDMQPRTINLLAEVLQETLEDYSCGTIKKARASGAYDTLMEELCEAVECLTTEIIEDYKGYSHLYIEELQTPEYQEEINEALEACGANRLPPINPPQTKAIDNDWYARPMLDNFSNHKPATVQKQVVKGPTHSNFTYHNNYEVNGFTSNIVLKIPESMMMELQYYVANINVEIAGFLLGVAEGNGVFRATRLHLSKQVVSGASVDVEIHDTNSISRELLTDLKQGIEEHAKRDYVQGDPTSIAFEYANTIRKTETIICQWHSHVKMSVFQSGVDEGTLRTLATQHDSMIMLIMNKDRNRRAWASQAHPFKIHNLDVAINIDNKLKYSAKSVDEVRKAIAANVYSSDSYEIPEKGKPNAGKITLKTVAKPAKIKKDKEGGYVYPDTNRKRVPISPIGANSRGKASKPSKSKDSNSGSWSCRQFIMRAFGEARGK